MSAEGWVRAAIRFWERSMRNRWGARRVSAGVTSMLTSSVGVDQPQLVNCGSTSSGIDSRQPSLRELRIWLRDFCATFRENDVEP
jgi:hypothetical protein